MADTADLKSVVERRAGSNPVSGTIYISRKKQLPLWLIIKGGRLYEASFFVWFGWSRR